MSVVECDVEIAADHTRPPISASVPPPSSEPVTPRASRKAHARVTRSVLQAADATAVLVAGLMARSALDVVLMGVLLLGLMQSAGLHRPRLTLSVLEDLPLLIAVTVATLGLSEVPVVLLRGPGSASALTHSALLLFVLVVPLRALAYAGLRRSRSSGALALRTVVIGCGAVGARVVEVLRGCPQAGLHPVGFLDGQPLLPPEQRLVPVLGGLGQLPALLARGAVDVVLVAFSEASEAEILEVLRACDLGQGDILSVPRFFEVRRRRHDDEHVGGLTFVRLRGTATTHALRWRLKRVFDVVAAGCLLLGTAPLLAVLAAAVRVEGGPGVLFRQERVGMGGRRFALLKFRSLRPATSHEAATTWSIAADARVGPVGRLLRRSSLDELPQLWNVLCGDMSMVGPRPERPHFVERFCVEHEEYVWRHRVPVGLTGWAQVNGLRGDTSIRERARYDNAYIENWSLWFDAKVLLRTARQLFNGG